MRSLEKTEIEQLNKKLEKLNKMRNQKTAHCDLCA